MVQEPESTQERVVISSKFVAAIESSLAESYRCHASFRSLRAENARLRAALATHAPHCLDEIDRP